MTLRRVLAAVLAAVALYSVSIVVRASFFSNGHGPVFWTAIGFFVVLAAGAFWGAKQLK